MLFNSCASRILCRLHDILPKNPLMFPEYNFEQIQICALFKNQFSHKENRWQDFSSLLKRKRKKKSYNSDLFRSKHLYKLHPFSKPPHTFLPLDIPFMFILSPDQSFLSSFFRQLSPSGIPPSFHSSSHTVLLSSSPPLPPPFLDPLIRLMYTGRGKSNKGVGGIRAIRREISSNVELRSLLSLPSLILFVKRCRGSRASKIPFRGVWR